MCKNVLDSTLSYNTNKLKLDDSRSLIGLICKTLSYVRICNYFPLTAPTDTLIACCFCMNCINTIARSSPS